MKPIIIERTVYGDKIKLLIEKIKEYDKFTIYQVYKVDNNNKIPLYKESYTCEQLKEFMKNKQNI